MSKAYEIYKQNVGGVTMDGETMKEFDELPEKIRKAWEAIDSDKELKCCFCGKIPTVYCKCFEPNSDNNKFACICNDCNHKRNIALKIWNVPIESYRYSISATTL